MNGRERRKGTYKDQINKGHGTKLSISEKYVKGIEGRLRDGVVHMVALYVYGFKRRFTMRQSQPTPCKQPCSFRA